VGPICSSSLSFLPCWIIIHQDLPSSPTVVAEAVAAAKHAECPCFLLSFDFDFSGLSSHHLHSSFGTQ
jgi:hypothetical protein